MPSTAPCRGSSSASWTDAGAGRGRPCGGAVAGGGVDHHDLVEHAPLAQRHQPLDDRPDGLGALASGEAHRHALAALGRDPLGWEAGVMKGPSVRKALAGGACHRLYYLNSLALDRTIEPWSALLDAGRDDGRLVREANEGPSEGRLTELPGELHPDLLAGLRGAGIERLYSHQAEALQAAWEGPLIVTTGTASGKSLCFNLPTLEVLCRDRRARALYLYPTKALAQDQARALNSLGLRRLRCAIYDGDTPREARAADPPLRQRGAHQPRHAPRGHPPQPRGVG